MGKTTHKAFKSAAEMNAGWKKITLKHYNLSQWRGIHLTLTESSQLPLDLNSHK